MMMVLGEFIFSLQTAAYEEFSRSTGQRWSAHERVGKRHSYQYLGVDEEEICLCGTMFPAFAGDAASLATLRDMANAGVPHILISGTGNVFGEYIVLDVSDRRGFLFDNGAAQRVDFSVKLKRYDDDDVANGTILDAISV